MNFFKKLGWGAEEEKKAPEPVKEETKLEAPKRAPVSKSKKILVVDDD
jgi:hypothetical protein